ncbi:hypothetical protein FM038_017170 [Shewanella eurypsychrophilus]|uniref:Mu-like prophage FluMu N-terminal domain-containing protein n=1 Tax=Shewanella eurypsychrophilus TaxID=2593656 RepID=A0ABX6VAU6_9GAMM|nr:MULTISPECIES: HI1506-related protein [Shewanella]QFU23731.1 hypothetical protein FS418_18960 [Shewanella sp. YLB-09]QPG58951.1 hypothetical protein FM038_017170 [Shewanella eurypsychrophilus]
MPNSNTTGTNKLRLVVITCLAHHGYRRAGVGFCKGENKFKADDFSESQLAQLGDDSRLKLQFVEADAPLVPTSLDASTFKSVDSQASKTLLDEGALVGDGLGVTVGPESDPHKQAIKALSFAEAIIELEPGNKDHFTGDGKPQCDVLSKLMDEPVSASERNALWASFKSEQAADQDAE